MTIFRCIAWLTEAVTQRALPRHKRRTARSLVQCCVDGSAASAAAGRGTRAELARASNSSELYESLICLAENFTSVCPVSKFVQPVNQCQNIFFNDRVAGLAMGCKKRRPRSH